ncbi:MAG: terminase large subunit [Clostridia bacterium]|nr:terminase large subunit [Clostridia bacterium]
MGSCKVFDVTKAEPIQTYIDLVRHGDYLQCKEQYAFCDWIERCFDGTIYFDAEQFEKYMKLQAHFPYNLFEWEKCLFALHNCVYYKESGLIRFPVLFGELGRGAGKNGYLSFEDFALCTPINGVREYHCDTFATSEEQASTSFNDIKNILDSNKNFYKQYWYWNKEEIKNLSTGSIIRYRTSNAKTKDGGRPGKINFDEYHQYINYDIIKVAKTGLGKKENPRQTIITSNGLVRGGPLDDMEKISMDILFKNMPDNGTIPFICRIDDEDDSTLEENWYKANPSLQYFPNLLLEMRLEAAEIRVNPKVRIDFEAKRLNRPPKELVNDITSWKNIIACNTKNIPDLTGYDCIAAIDFAKTNDFVAAGLLFYKDGLYYWLTHSWVCSQSADLERIKAPLAEWESKGLLTVVDAPDIDPSIPVGWLADMNKKYRIGKVCVDSFRIVILRAALKAAGFDVDDKNKVWLIKRVTIMRFAPVILSAFSNQIIRWEESMLMCWYVNNAYLETDKSGNMLFLKKEAKSRKTDGFMCMVNAFCGSEDLKTESRSTYKKGSLKSYSY